MKAPLFLLGALLGIWIMWQCWLSRNWAGFYITFVVMLIYVGWYVVVMTRGGGGGGNDIDSNQ